jgi:HlyD family secretion protein
MVVQLRMPQMGAQKRQNDSQPPDQPSRTRSLFRQQALDQSASPEQLDLPIQIVSPQRWLSLLALGGLVSAGVVWSFVGKIPITVSGKGILVYPSQIMTVHSPSSGRVAKVDVKVGDRIKKGQVLAVLDQSEMKQQLELAQSKLVQLEIQDETAQAAKRYRAELDQRATAQQKRTFEQELQTIQTLTPELHNRSLESFSQQRQTLQARLIDLRAQSNKYQQVWQRIQALADSGGYPQNTLVKDEQEYRVKPQADILAVETELKQLEEKEAQARQDHLSQVNKANEVQSQLQELDSKSATQAEQDLTTDTLRSKEMQETLREIAQLQLQLKQNTQILSDYDGYVRELSLNPGQRLDSGASVGVIAAHQDSQQLQGIAFLPVEDGKKLSDRMIQSGIGVQITPTTVKREEYGGIVAKVTQVSRYPITQTGAAHLVGNPGILPSLMSNEGAYIAVFMDLEKRASGANFQANGPKQYRWSSSQGPDQEITEGTTTTVNLTIEERTPISYVIPLLKSLVSS